MMKSVCSGRCELVRLLDRMAWCLCTMRDQRSKQRQFKLNARCNWTEFKSKRVLTCSVLLLGWVDVRQYVCIASGVIT